MKVSCWIIFLSKTFNINVTNKIWHYRNFPIFSDPTNVWTPFKIEKTINFLGLKFRDILRIHKKIQEFLFPKYSGGKYDQKSRLSGRSPDRFFRFCKCQLRLTGKKHIQVLAQLLCEYQEMTKWSYHMVFASKVWNFHWINAVWVLRR